MTLTIHTEEDDQRQLKLTVEVPEDRVEKAMRAAARKLARDVHVPGFRPGKAPYHVLLQRVGKDALRAEAVEEIIPTIFEEALGQVDMAEVYGQPRLDDVAVEPLVLHFTVPLPPLVELGDYRAIRQEIEPVVVADEAIENALEQVRRRHEVTEPVDRPVEVGDVVTLSGTGWLVSEAEAPETTAGAEVELAAGDAIVGATGAETEVAHDAETVEAELDETEFDEDEFDEDEFDEDEFDEDEFDEDEFDEDEFDEDEFDEDELDEEVEDEDDNVIFDHESIELLMDPEQLFPGTAFIDNLAGLSVGDEKEFTIAFPEGYIEDELAGREATFTITVLEVKRRDVPALDDDLAKQEGNYETVADLRQAIHENLERQAVKQAREALLEKMVDDLLADATIVYPPAAVDLEIDNMVDTYKNQVTRSGWKWEDYLQLQGLTEETLRDNFRESAGERLERNLTLRQFILNEKLTVEAADIDAAIEERVKQFDDEALKQEMRDYFRSGYGFNMISGQVLQDKVYDRVEAIFTGNAPELDGAEDEGQGIDEQISDEEEE